MTNVDIGFQVQGGKALLIRHANKKEISRDVVLEVYQLILGHIASNRDYSNVTSIRKLLRIIDLECEPDDSDDESEGEPSKPAAIPAAKPATKARQPAARTVRRTPAKPAKKESDSDDE